MLETIRYCETVYNKLFIQGISRVIMSPTELKSNDNDTSVVPI
jgi:hypothetical protein